MVPYVLLVFYFLPAFFMNVAVGLVSLWRFNLIRGEGFQEQLSGLICWKDPVFVKCLILREIITASTCFVLHQQR